MSIAKYHIGESTINSQGKSMTIVDYRKRIDIDVQFEDGVIRKGVRYENFEQGKILHPDDMPKRKYIGETYTNKFGETAKIINIIDSHKVDIQFEDGAIKESFNYQHFKNLRFRHPDYKKFYNNSMIGKVFKNNNGQIFKIIDYKNENEVTVQFEDGSKRKNIRLVNIKRGNVRHPNKPFTSNEMYILYLLKDYGFKKYPQSYFKKLGFKGKEIDFYNHDLKIGIEFDGDRWHSFDDSLKKDLLKNEICSESGIDLIRIRPDSLPVMKDNTIKIFNYHISNPNNYSPFFNALKDVFVYLNKEYKLNIPIDIYIDPEEYYQWRSNNFALDSYDHVGEETFNTQGLKMKIVDYINYNNLTVEFEDSNRRYGVQYSEFINGQIRHPNEKHHQFRGINETI